MTQSAKNTYFILFVSVVYLLLTFLCLNNCYFWDNIQQTSKEAHWFYFNNFKFFFIPARETLDGISGTGYHPPLMGFMTAVLWKIVGYKLWVSHAFVLLWACLLIFNEWKLIRIIFQEKYVGWILAIVLLESTLLTQYAIASPDFILFTAFIISLRAIFERRNMLLAVGIFFLCCINMRGVFVGVIFFAIHNYYSYLQSEGKYNFKSFFKLLLPYIPTLLVLTVYFTTYLLINGWFFHNSNYSTHYSMPNSFGRILKHFAEFGLRSVENGRIVIWLLGMYVGMKMIKSSRSTTPNLKVLIALFLSLTGLYVLFVFISQMPFSARYFMPQFFVLTLFTLYGIIEFVDVRKVKLLFLVVLLFELTGNLWIYPDRIAKSWDGTLAHLPFYELRKDCLKYIDEQEIDYKDVSAGFSLYGDRRFLDLQQKKQVIKSGNNGKYFIYSNISNNEDSFVDSLRNQNFWTPLKRFDKGYVCIILYKRK
jgi:hypothetical protein